ncbi:ATP-binding cassette domain-containing protein [Cohnella sp. AR92]|uniref:ATP-binding cassette domain-containing protein n=1 Tax=Cohnella sp. AR92 TaxID=648716 RepID=UPI000F8F0533|nr:ABC transporter ATP-binding protein [Cohnella sp. AR92]RUS44257.1 ABC transporter ATP-binding protein [Cohnella sp. AR92]
METERHADGGIVELDRIHKRYSKEFVLRGVSITIRSGEILAVMGRNGSGKSTLLRIAAGLTVPSRGDRKVRGEPGMVIAYAPDRLPKLRFTPREYLRHMVEIDSRTVSSSHANSSDSIESYLERFGMANTGKTLMKDFSKGMLQKINLIQAFLRDPHVLLLDEPFSGLDDASRKLLADELTEQKSRGKAVVVASHDGEWVSQTADRIVVLNGGEISSERKADTQKKVPRKVIECLLPDGRGADREPGAEGIVRAERSGRRARYEVEAPSADRLLMSLLEQGASIVSVQEKGDGL